MSSDACSELSRANPHTEYLSNKSKQKEETGALEKTSKELKQTLTSARRTDKHEKWHSDGICHRTASPS